MHGICKSVFSLNIYYEHFPILVNTLLNLDFGQSQSSMVKCIKSSILFLPFVFSQAFKIINISLINITVFSFSQRSIPRGGVVDLRLRTFFKAFINYCQFINCYEWYNALGKQLRECIWSVVSKILNIFICTNPVPGDLY